MHICKQNVCHMQIELADINVQIKHFVSKHEMHCK